LKIEIKSLKIISEKSNRELKLRGRYKEEILSGWDGATGDEIPPLARALCQPQPAPRIGEVTAWPHYLPLAFLYDLFINAPFAFWRVCLRVLHLLQVTRYKINKFVKRKEKQVQCWLVSVKAASTRGLGAT
jgi:hypothetical protein